MSETQTSYDVIEGEVTHSLATITRPEPLMPVGSPADIVAAMRAYEQTRQAMMVPADYQIAGKDTFPKKSYFTKLSIAYQVSIEVKPGYPIYHRGENGALERAECVVRAIAPNGRYTEGWGACAITESRYTGRDGRPNIGGRAKIEHDIPATAETRATNRALSKLFGYSGEVSWEEVTADGENREARDQQSQPEPPSRGAVSDGPLKEACTALAEARGAGESWNQVLRVMVNLLGIKAKETGDLKPADRENIIATAQTQILQLAANAAAADTPAPESEPAEQAEMRI